MPTGPAIFDPALLKAGPRLQAAPSRPSSTRSRSPTSGRCSSRNEGNITRSAQEAGLTRYHLRELLKRHGLTGQGE